MSEEESQVEFKRQGRHHDYTRKAIHDEQQRYEDYYGDMSGQVKCPECKHYVEKDEQFMEYEAGSLWLLCECGNEIEVEEK